MDERRPGDEGPLRPDDLPQTAPPAAAAAAAATGLQQPQSGWVQPAPMVVQQGGSSGLAKLGAIILILFGLLTTLAGALIAVVATALRDALATDFVQLSDAFADAGVVIGIVVVVIGIVEVLTGIFAWRGSGWARVGGIIYGLLFGLLFLASVFAPRATTADVNTGNTVATTAVAAIAYLFVAVVFLLRYRTEPKV
jgi:hypothetical protein